MAEVIRGDLPGAEEHGGAPRLPASVATLNLGAEPGGVGENLRLDGRAIRGLCGRDPSLRGGWCCPGSSRAGTRTSAPSTGTPRPPCPVWAPVSSP